MDDKEIRVIFPDGSRNFVDFIHRKEFPSNFQTLYENLSAAVKVENELVNHRLGWFLTISIVLVSAVAFLVYARQDADAVVGIVKAIIGEEEGISTELEKRYAEKLDISMGRLKTTHSLIAFVSFVGLLTSISAYISIMAANLSMSKLSHSFKFALKKLLMGSGFRVRPEIEKHQFSGCGGELRFRNLEALEFPLLLGAGSKRATYGGHSFPLFVTISSTIFWAYVLMYAKDKNLTNPDVGPVIVFVLLAALAAGLSILYLDSKARFEFSYLTDKDIFVRESDTPR